jgi:hypothetical protein
MDTAKPKSRSPGVRKQLMSASQQPNDQKRNEETKPESRGITGPLRDNPAVVIGAIATLLTFVAAWAAVDNHHTILIWTIIAGIVSCSLMIYLYWPRRRKKGNKHAPSQRAIQPPPLAVHDTPQPAPIPLNTESEPPPFEAEHDRLAKEVVLLKIQNERLLSKVEKDEYKTTELKHNDSEDEVETRQLSQQESTESNPPKRREVFGPPSPKIPVSRIPFPSGPGDLWMEYTQDVFYGVIWRWHYKPEIDNTPRGLRAYCPECETDIPLQEHRPRTIKTVGQGIYLQCGYHSSVKHKCNSDDYAHIKKLIQKKIDDGTWVEMVNKQRMAIGLSPYSPDIVGRRHKLEEIKEQILIALAQHSRCQLFTVQSTVSYQYFQLGVREKPNLTEGAVKYQLEDLEEQKYVTIDRYGHKSDEYSLDRKGGKYLEDNNLWPSHPAVMAPSPLKQIDIVQRQILLIIWKMSDFEAYADHQYIEEYMIFFRAIGEKPPLDGEMLKHHIDILLNERKFIKEEREDFYQVAGYSLTRTGREYVINNKLLESELFGYLCEYIKGQQAGNENS